MIEQDLEDGNADSGNAAADDADRGTSGCRAGRMQVDDEGVADLSAFRCDGLGMATM